MGKCDFLELNGNDPHILFYAVGKHFILSFHGKYSHIETRLQLLDNIKELSLCH